MSRAFQIVAAPVFSVGPHERAVEFIDKGLHTSYRTTRPILLKAMAEFDYIIVGGN